jgi:hypothetical protein
MAQRRFSWLLVETIIQFLVLGFIGFSSYLVNAGGVAACREHHHSHDHHVHTLAAVCGSGNTLFLYLYICLSNGLLVSVLSLYLQLILGRRSCHVMRYEPPNPANLTEPFECANSKGDWSYCTKGSCGGAWKPPRTHHCSICGICRIGFDHHCPWLGNCVTIYDMKAFLLFLFLVPITWVVCVSPFASLILDHATNALLVSQTSLRIRNLWWDRWYSWLAGGPLGRYIVGTALGYRDLKAQHPEEINGSAGLFLQPHLRTALVALVALLFSCFTLVSASKNQHSSPLSG